MFSIFDQQCMQRALELAMLAQQQGEVPVGAVLALGQSVIAEGQNQPIAENDPTAHAEIVALRLGAERLQNYRLVNTTLYCTLEPCCMCAGAIVHARVGRIVYATKDQRSGAGGTVFNILQSPRLNHRVAVEGGLLAEASQDILKQFFKKKRAAGLEKF